MQVVVTARLETDEGVALLGYTVSRVIVMGEDAQSNMLDGAQSLLNDVDDARAALCEQAAREGIALSRALKDR